MTEITKTKTKTKLPVTLLSGFLGSGKTTLLQHILRSKDHGLRCAVIVNDMAEINIDGATVENSQVVQREEKLVQMQNGCICCTLREDLLEEINRLAAENRFDYLLIESTGISEPMQVAETFTTDFSEHMEEKHGNEKQDEKSHDDTIQAMQSLSENARLDTCVSMVDACSFFSYYNSSKFLAEEFDDAEEEAEKTVVDLMVDQIEFANVILLNKLDACTPENADKIEKTLRGLNPSAKILRCTYSKINVKEILNTGLFDMTKAITSSGWLRSLKEEVVPETVEYGISSFVYRQRRPFHPKRLYDLMEDAFLVLEDVGSPENENKDENENENEEEPEGEMNGIEFENEDKMKDNESTTGDDASEADSGEEMEGVQVAQSFGDGESEACFERKVKSVFQNVFRSKGFLWIAGKDDSMGEWSQAGIIVTVSNSGKWYVNKPEEMEEFDEDMKTAILSDFDKDPKIGDRRQEIVFIGDFKKDEEKEALRYALDKCLMQDNETFDPTEDPWEEWY